MSEEKTAQPTRLAILFWQKQIFLSFCGMFRAIEMVQIFTLINKQIKESFEQGRLLGVPTYPQGTPLDTHVAYRKSILKFFDVLTRRGMLTPRAIGEPSQDSNEPLERKELVKYSDNMEDEEFLRLIQQLDNDQAASHKPKPIGYLYSHRLKEYPADDLKRMTKRILDKFNEFLLNLGQSQNPFQLPFFLFQFYTEYAQSVVFDYLSCDQSKFDNLIKDTASLHNLVVCFPRYKKQIFDYVLSDKEKFKQLITSRDDATESKNWLVFLKIFPEYEKEIFCWISNNEQFVRLLDDKDKGKFFNYAFRDSDNNFSLKKFRKLIRNVNDLTMLALCFPEHKKEIFTRAFLFSTDGVNITFWGQKFRNLIKNVGDLGKLVTCFSEYKKEIFNHMLLSEDGIFDFLICSAEELNKFKELYKEFKDRIVEKVLEDHIHFISLFLYSIDHTKDQRIGLDYFEEMFPGSMSRVQDKVFSLFFQIYLRQLTLNSYSHNVFYAFHKFTDASHSTKKNALQKKCEEFIATPDQPNILDAVAFFAYAHTSFLVITLRNNSFCDKNGLYAALCGHLRSYIERGFPNHNEPLDNYMERELSHRPARQLPQVIERADGVLIVQFFSPICFMHVELLNSVFEVMPEYYPPLDITHRKIAFPPKKTVTHLSIEDWQSELRKKFSDPDLRLVQVPGVNGGSIRLLTIKPMLEIHLRMMGIGKIIGKHQIEVPIGNLSHFKKVLDELPSVSNSSTQSKDFSLAKMQQTWKDAMNFSIKMETMLPDGKKSCVLLELPKKEEAFCFWEVMHEEIPSLSPVANGKFSISLEDLPKIQIVGNLERQRKMCAFLEQIQKAKREREVSVFDKSLHPAVEEKKETDLVIRMVVPDLQVDSFADESKTTQATGLQGSLQCLIVANPLHTGICSVPTLAILTDSKSSAHDPSTSSVGSGASSTYGGHGSFFSASTILLASSSHNGDAAIPSPSLVASSSSSNCNNFTPGFFNPDGGDPSFSSSEPNTQSVLPISAGSSDQSKAGEEFLGAPSDLQERAMNEHTLS